MPAKYNYELQFLASGSWTVTVKYIKGFVYRQRTCLCKTCHRVLGQIYSPDIIEIKIGYIGCRIGNLINDRLLDHYMGEMILHLGRCQGNFNLIIDDNFSPKRMR